MIDLFKIVNNNNYVQLGYFSKYNKVSQWIGYVANKTKTTNLYLCKCKTHNDVKFDALGQCKYDLPLKPVSYQKIVAWEKGKYAILETGECLPSNDDIPYADDEGNLIWDIAIINQWHMLKN